LPCEQGLPRTQSCHDLSVMAWAAGGNTTKLSKLPRGPPQCHPSRLTPTRRMHRRAPHPPRAKPPCNPMQSPMRWVGDRVMHPRAHTPQGSSFFNPPQPPSIRHAPSMPDVSEGARVPGGWARERSAHATCRTHPHKLNIRGPWLHRGKLSRSLGHSQCVPTAHQTVATPFGQFQVLCAP
jgi:hypothetical protein